LKCDTKNWQEAKQNPYNMCAFGFFFIFGRGKGGLTVKLYNFSKRENKKFQVEEIQQGATVCRYLFTAKLLYMFRTSIVPIIRIT